MTLAQWGKRENERSLFDFECYTVGRLWSPNRQVFEGFAIHDHSVPGRIARFLLMENMGIWLGVDPEQTYGMAVILDESEKPPRYSGPLTLVS